MRPNVVNSVPPKKLGSCALYAAITANTVPISNQKIADTVKNTDEVRMEASISLSSARTETSGDEYGLVTEGLEGGAWLIEKMYLLVKI